MQQTADQQKSEFSEEEIQEIESNLEVVLAGNDEGFGDGLADIINALYASSRGEGPALDETEMLQRLHQLLMARGLYLEDL